jgi:(E)-4-hydroxy-3-methylbut-2-enyl-diphosphate synthase
MSYCTSRFQSIRRRTIEVRAGEVGMGGGNPIRVQSMTTSDTQDIAATVRQAIALAEVGCEIVRVTAPNVAAARCLREIRAEFTRTGFSRVPLVADIHFLPQAAMEAVEHVEKVRINPGNYADKKRFAVREYTDADYQRELERLHESFTPLVLRAKELGRCLRIGTNHGRERAGVPAHRRVAWLPAARPVDEVVEPKGHDPGLPPAGGADGGRGHALPAAPRRHRSG